MVRATSSTSPIRPTGTRDANLRSPPVLAQEVLAGRYLNLDITARAIRA